MEGIKNYKIGEGEREGNNYVKCLGKKNDVLCEKKY
jgi:hypothetical protein